MNNQRIKLEINEEITLSFPIKDPFTIKVFKSGFPNYRDVICEIGVSSNKNDYESYNSLISKPYLFYINNVGFREVPEVFVERLLNLMVNYLRKYQDNAYRIIKYNDRCMNTFTTQITISVYDKLVSKYGLVDLNDPASKLISLYSDETYDNINHECRLTTKDFRRMGC